MASSKKKKKIPKQSFEDWSRQQHGVADDEQSIARRKAWDDLYTSYTTEDDDIAPVKTTVKSEDVAPTKEQGKGWFQKGALGDGFSWKNLGKTIGGSITDLGENIFGGGIEGGEGFWDFLLRLGAANTQQQMNEAAQHQIVANAITGNKEKASEVVDRYKSYSDEVNKATEEEIKKDLWDGEAVAKKIVDPAEKLVGIDPEGADSVFAEKSDALAQSAGQLLVSQAVNYALPGTGLFVMGGMSFGSEMEDALQQGATWDEASLSATISAVAETGTELLFGGISFGHGTLDDLITDKIAKNITNKTARHLLNFIGKSAGEGFEEILSGAVSAVGQKMSYMEEKELKELFSSEEALDSFIGGAVLGGIGSAGKAVKGEIKGIDSVTGLTKNEQKENKDRVFIKVGENLYDSKYVEAIMRAVENPVFSVSDYYNGFKTLVAVGENGRAMLMPVSAGSKISAVYEAQPIQEEVAPLPIYTEPVSEPTVAELDAQRLELESKIAEALQADDMETFERLSYEHQALTERIAQAQEEDAAFESERLESLDDADAPIEQEAPFYDERPDTTPLTKKAVTDIVKPVKEMLGLSNRQTAEVKAAVEKYSSTEYASREELHEVIKDSIGNIFEEEVPGVREVQNYLRKNKIKVSDAIKNDIADYNQVRLSHFGKIRVSNEGIDVDSAYQELASLYPEFFPDDIANPSDQFMRMIEVADMSKTIETEYEVDNEVIEEAADIIIEGINGYKQGELQKLAEAEAKHIPKFAPGEDIAPVPEAYEAIRPQKPKTEKYRMKRATPEEQARAEILTEEAEIKKKNNRFWSIFAGKVLDKGAVFEKLSLKSKNRELIGKWNFTLSSESRAQRFMKNGGGNAKSLDSIRKEVESTGKTKQFYEYLYHKHNIDRMTLAERYKNTPNKAVFGDSVTAEMSREAVAQLEKSNPEFKQFAQDVYNYNAHLRNLLVESGVISKETADLWSEMYPHYVPIRRVGDTGLNINVPLDSGKTGVNAPIKKAKGGSSDILPLFDTMGQRTIQTYKAIAKNNFGVELKNTLKSKAESGPIGVDEIIDSIDSQDGLLQEGKNGKNPTFTVFENGKKVTFEITEEMYDALKPTSKALAYRSKVLNTISNVHRGLLTEYNPVFMIKNAIKDTQDILLNSQHAIKTYANLPKAYAQIVTKGKWYTEYLDNGGERNSYFDNETNTFEKEKSTIRKIVGMPLDVISAANNFVEMAPRLAEYIASRNSGRSVEVSMLDAARVTTNFSAGGDLTKFLNSNGCTFLNASVQGAMQQVRNVREAKANGLKGWANLATKVAIAGLPALLLNGMLWDDDEEYEELSDYVKQNYYIVAKTGEGKFIRIPKGRALAVIQNAMDQVKNAATGDDEVDLKSFLELVVSNLAPNSPIDNNILAPIIQVANNETWYGEDLVPTRLQDLPAAEQFDESTDSISKWLGENLNYSPYKINYLLNQYSGGVGDVVMPMLTPEAESGDNSTIGNMIAPLKDQFTTDSVMNNQNISDFYDKVDELTTLAKSSEATDEDVLRYKYINSVNSELGELYGQKREIQNNLYLSDAEKYSRVRAIQEDINSLARDSLNTYDNLSVDNGYATVGNRHYRLNKNGEWEKISDNQLEKQEDVTSFLGISGSEYWSDKEAYDYAYESPGKYGISKVIGDYDVYKEYKSDLYDIKGDDADGDGKTDSGSSKAKKKAYIWNLPLDDGQKYILYRSLYSSKEDKNKYNGAIVQYLDSRDDISWEEMKAILEELDMTVYDDGRITW